ncbi:hypothetical protein BJ508DRAFT_326835, partial [Ascobolus immersus RN42]
MVQSDGLSFTIETDTTPLHEYDYNPENPEQSSNLTPTETRLSRTTYVELPPHHSSRPQTFRVRIRALEPINYDAEPGYHFVLSVDGVKSRFCKLMARDEDPGTVVYTGIYVDDEDGNGISERELCFQQIQVVDDELAGETSAEVGR